MNGASGNQFRANHFIDSDRYRELSRRRAYYESTQHDHKVFDFDGRVISATQPLISSETIAYYVPLSTRRPSTPYRITRVIVNAFTNLIFGEERFPAFQVAGDSNTQDYIQALSKAMDLPTVMISARNFGGSTGTVGISWCFIDGQPQCNVHEAQNLYVHEWEDRSRLIPLHVSEVYQTPRDIWDPSKRKFIRQYFWFRRDWTPDADIVFQETLCTPDDPIWIPDEKRSAIHNDDALHFEWIQNLPTNDIDGLPDYDVVYDQSDMLDIIRSVTSRAASLNLDPTLVLKMDPDLLQRQNVSKGSDRALKVGIDGDAKYMELSGQSIDAGIRLSDAHRRAILEVAQCVIPDPDKVAAQGTSSVAMKMMYAPMLGKTGVMRSQYAKPMSRMFTKMLQVARKASKTTVVVMDPDGNAKEAALEIKLPPRVEQVPILDPKTGTATGQFQINLIERDPGMGNDIDTQWPPYFAPTPTDQSLVVTTLSTAVAQKPIMSQQSATEIAMSFFGRESSEEWQRVQQSQAIDEAKQAEMFADKQSGKDSESSSKESSSTDSASSDSASKDSESEEASDSSSEDAKV